MPLSLVGWGWKGSSVASKCREVSQLAPGYQQPGKHCGATIAFRALQWWLKMTPLSGWIRSPGSSRSSQELRHKAGLPDIHWQDPGELATVLPQVPREPGAPCPAARAEPAPAQVGGRQYIPSHGCSHA